MFSLFPSKRELFSAAVERGFELIGETFSRAAAEFDPEQAEPGTDVLLAMGQAYVAMLESNRDYLMLQHQAYAACDDELIRERVRRQYALSVAHAQQLSGAETTVSTSSSATECGSTWRRRWASRTCRRDASGCGSSWPTRRRPRAEREPAQRLAMLLSSNRSSPSSGISSHGAA